MDPDDDLERFDDAIGAALRRHASELTGPIETVASWADVEQRARTRRRWRLAAASVGTAAAASVAVLGFLALTGDEREVLRAPATQPSDPASTTDSVVTTTAPPATTTIALPTTSVVATLPPTAPSTAPASTETPPAPSSTAPAAQPPSTIITVAPSTTADAPDPPASVTSYSSAGGSIDVRLAGGAIALDGDPAPTAGWTVRIDDNGPDRVRVRFERGDERSEIRVDLTSDGRLEPRVTEG